MNTPVVYTVKKVSSALHTVFKSVAVTKDMASRAHARPGRFFQVDQEPPTPEQMQLRTEVKTGRNEKDVRGESVVADTLHVRRYCKLLTAS